MVAHDGRELIFKTIIDVTARNRHERETRQSQMLRAYALRNLTKAVALFDAHGRMVICNDRNGALIVAAAYFVPPGLHWEPILRALTRCKIPCHMAGRESQWVQDVLTARGSGDSF
ncbi:MAG: hypothetical protein AAGC92_02545 [Pseudomonadota bacterium]